MLHKWSQNAEERCRIITAHLRQSDTIAAIAHIYAAMRSLHMHTCTHTHQYSDTIAVFSRCVHTHTYSAIQSLHKHTNLHSETIAATIKSMINHICKGTRSTQSTQIFYINVFPMRHCLSSLVETRLCISPQIRSTIHRRARPPQLERNLMLLCQLCLL